MHSELINQSTPCKSGILLSTLKSHSKSTLQPSAQAAIVLSILTIKIIQFPLKNMILINIYFKNVVRLLHSCSWTNKYHLNYVIVYQLQTASLLSHPMRKSCENLFPVPVTDKQALRKWDRTEKGAEKTGRARKNNIYWLVIRKINYMAQVRRKKEKIRSKAKKK